MTVLLKQVISKRLRVRVGVKAIVRCSMQRRFITRSSAGSALGGGDWTGGASDRPGGSGRGVAAQQAEGAYSEQTLRSLENIEEAQLNYDLVRVGRTALESHSLVTPHGCSLTDCDCSK